MLPFKPLRRTIFSLDSSSPEKNIRTGITNSVRKNETTNDQKHSTVEPIPSTIKTVPEKEIISLAETQFYARTSNTPCPKRPDVNDKKETIDDSKKVIP